MSSKPKIYAYCNAGCKWETVHADDFPAKFVFLTKAEYDSLSEYEEDVLYYIYDEGHIVSSAKEVTQSIKGLSLTSIFKYFDDETGELTSGTVKLADKANSTYYTDFTNNKTWNEIELTHDNSNITSLSVNKTYQMYLRMTSGNTNFLINYGLVHIPSHLESGQSNKIVLSGTMGSHTYVVELIVNGDYSDNDEIKAWFYLDNTMTPNYAKLRFREIR